MKSAAEMEGAHQEIEISITDDNAVILEKVITRACPHNTHRHQLTFTQKRKVGDDSSQDNTESAESSSVTRLEDVEPSAQGRDDAAAKEKPFPFLDLPPELRNMIYEIALVRRYPIYNPCCSRLSPLPRPLEARHQRFKDENRMCPALLATSQMIYTEAQTLLLAQSFVFTGTAGFYEFLQEIGPRSRVLLRDVTIRWLLLMEETNFPKAEDVTRLLDDAKQMKFFRVIVPNWVNHISLRTTMALHSFSIALRRSHFASSRVHTKAEKFLRPYQEGRIQLRTGITTEIWELST